MPDLFKKRPSALEKKLRMIDEELSRVRHDMRALSRFVSKPGKGAESLRLKTGGGLLTPAARKPEVPSRPAVPPPPAVYVARKQEPVAPSRGARPSAIDSGRSGGLYAGRLGDYLASSFEASGGTVLKHEQRMIRARAILWFIVAVVIGCLVVRKLIQLYS